MKGILIAFLMCVCLLTLYFTYSFTQSISTLESRQETLIQKFNRAKITHPAKRSAPAALPRRKGVDPLRPADLKAHTDVELDPNGILDSTNAMRKHFGVAPLSLNAALSAAALERARHMFRVGYFDHNDPDGQSFDLPIEMTGYQMLLSGENIALGNFENNTELVRAWYNSPGHKKNLLFGGFSEIGVAALKGNYQGRETWIAVQLFATPRSGCNLPDQDLKKNIDIMRTNNNRRLEVLEVYRDALEQPGISEERYKGYQKKFEQELKLFEEGQKLVNEDVTNFNEQVASYNNCAQQLSTSYSEFSP